MMKCWKWGSVKKALLFMYKKMKALRLLTVLFGCCFQVHLNTELKYIYRLSCVFRIYFFLITVYFNVSFTHRFFFSEWRQKTTEQQWRKADQDSPPFLLCSKRVEMNCFNNQNMALLCQPQELVRNSVNQQKTLIKQFIKPKVTQTNLRRGCIYS